MDIKIVIRGGLGNQLFQFFFGEYLKHTYQIANVLYVPDFERDSYGRFLLFDRLFPSATNRIVKKADFNSDHIVDTEDLSLIERLLKENQSGDIAFRGYWQDISYAARLIRDGFINRGDGLTEGCALHIRRVDYAHLGQLRMSYYEGALEAIGNPDFFVFTDEPNFAHHYFCHYKGYLGVLSTSDSIVDFVRFSTFGEKIVSNSTYAIASAILGPKCSKVIYPSTWGLREEFQIRSVPSSWLKMPASYVEV